MTWLQPGLPLPAGEANTMKVLLSENEVNQQSGAAVQRFGRAFLTLSVTILGLAVAYFSALYLIAH